VRSADIDTICASGPPANVTTELSVNKTPAGAVMVIASPKAGVVFETAMLTVAGVTRTGTTWLTPLAETVKELLAIAFAVTWNLTAFWIRTDARAHVTDLVGGADLVALFVL
jgi:hypothetical protein